MLRRLIHKFRPQKDAPPRLPYTHVDLFHWQPDDGRVNFGDHLSRIIVQKILLDQKLSLDDEVSRQARMLGIGSILHFAKDGDVIWGSGVNGKIPEHMFTARKLDIRAVRGPLSAEWLRARGFDVPDVFGDPGLLTAHLFKDRFTVRPETKHVFVPNLHDLSLVAHRNDMISPYWGWNKVVDRITEAELVLASSLHGLVIAESFGIPARYVRLSETEGLFKYKDYVFGSGRNEFSYACSIEEGLEMGGMEPVAYDPQPLLRAFPKDLWL